MGLRAGLTGGVCGGSAGVGGLSSNWRGAGAHCGWKTPYAPKQFALALMAITSGLEDPRLHGPSAHEWQEDHDNGGWGHTVCCVPSTSWCRWESDHPARVSYQVTLELLTRTRHHAKCFTYIIMFSSHIRFYYQSHFWGEKWRLGKIQ